MENYNKTIIRYLIASIVCLLFALVYEYFSHGVYSIYMCSCPVFPFVGGFLGFLLLKKSGRPYPSGPSGIFYNLSIETFTLGNIVAGVFDIYGSDNPYVIIYWIAGGLMLLSSFVAFYMHEHSDAASKEKGSDGSPD